MAPALETALGLLLPQISVSNPVDFPAAASKRAFGGHRPAGGLDPADFPRQAGGWPPAPASIPPALQTSSAAAAARQTAHPTTKICSTHETRDQDHQRPPAKHIGNLMAP
ncbi:hypothetical protein DFH27DRAFT_523234 [Peziza echinospora]|nr:hypothetical protein DFH27DRAFT_523234 [Peziza echinospora]